ncbi:nitronate monooxygenase [Saccharococcus caldoxylosilyticus]|uniref:nitronate monooxygenase n=1 Tax=Saccharococcus caldoxylosilyticus TaxID=81408 RepID=UPI0008FB12CF
MYGRDIAAVLVTGACNAQLGTAFSCCPESRANSLHKKGPHQFAISSYHCNPCAFTGRPVGGLVTRFLRI